MKTFDSVPSEHWIHDYLHPEEIKYGLRLPASSNRISFFLGRLAMRSIVFQNDSYSNHVILRDEYGRPSLPAGFLGSISHKKATAVALAIEKHDTINMAVGVDLEYALDSKAGIATKVLRKEEIDSLGQVEVSLLLECSAYLF
jgi:4'-phosphopantetheinyl transferase EntD